MFWFALDFSFFPDKENNFVSSCCLNVVGLLSNRPMNKNKNSKVVVSHTAPRITSRTKLAPAGCRTIEPITADKIELNFVARVELLENGCWLWHGSVDTPHGNNKRPVPTFFAANGRADHKLVRAYAYAYEKRIGELPDQKFLVFRNACGLALCANPNHYTIEKRGEILEKEANPILRHNLATATKCRNGLHDKTPENTLYVGSAKKPVCRPCRKETERTKYHRRKAKAEN